MRAKLHGITSRASVISRLLFLNCRENSRRPIYRSCSLLSFLPSAACYGNKMATFIRFIIACIYGLFFRPLSIKRLTSCLTLSTVTYSFIDRTADFKAKCVMFSRLKPIHRNAWKAAWNFRATLLYLQIILFVTFIYKCRPRTLPFVQIDLGKRQKNLICARFFTSSDF
jgi:hypothetical protein